MSKKSKDIKIRVAKPRDKGLFRKLWKEFLEEEHIEGKDNPITMLPTDKNLDVFCHLFDQYTSEAIPGFALFYREDAVYLCGYNGEGFDTDNEDLKAQAFGVYVRPEFRNKGISKAIYKESDRICKEKKMFSVIGAVREGNEASISSIKQSGWKVYGQILYKDLREE